MSNKPKTLEDYKWDLHFLEMKKEEAEEFLKSNPEAVTKEAVESLLKKMKLLIYRYKNIIQDIKNSKKE